METGEPYNGVFSRVDEDHEPLASTWVFVDFEHVLSQCPIDPIFANDLEVTTTEGREKLNRLIMTKYSNDTLSNVPSCECGNLFGPEHLNEICEVCGDTCETMLNRPVYPMVWLRAPGDVKAFINPSVWYDLSKTMNKAGCDDLEWLTNPKYVPEGKLSIRIQRLQEQGVGRGINFFVDNFESVMRAYIAAWRTRGDKPRPEREAFIDYCELLIARPNYIFSKYLPMPSRTTIVMEESNEQRYLEKNIAELTNPMMMLIRADQSSRRNNLGIMEQKTVSAIKQFYPFYIQFCKDIMSKKPGMLRKNIAGAKVGNTARAVIVSNHGPHRYDEIHFPWKASISLFRIHLYNLCLKDDLTPKQTFQLFLESATKCTDRMSNYLDELLRLAGPDGIEVIMNRTPTLSRLSICMHRILKILKDPRMASIVIGVLAIKQYNADFDGDAMAVYHPVDQRHTNRFKPFMQHHSILCMRNPRKFASTANLPDACARLVTNYLLDGERRKNELLTEEKVVEEV